MIKNDFVKEIFMEVKDVFYLLGCLAGTIMGFITLAMILKEIKKIRIGSDDGDIKAAVVEWRLFYTGDIRPILLYTIDGKEKKYEYHFYHDKEEYPIGKEVNLKLSSVSGLAYDKKDLIKGLLLRLFGTLFFVAGLIIGIYVLFVLR